MLGELAIGFDFNVRSWHRADKLSELKVRYEREAEVNVQCSERQSSPIDFFCYVPNSLCALSIRCARLIVR